MVAREVVARVVTREVVARVVVASVVVAREVGARVVVAREVVAGKWLQGKWLHSMNLIHGNHAISLNPLVYKYTVAGIEIYYFFTLYHILSFFSNCS